MSERYTAVIKIIKVEDTREGSGTQARNISKDIELLSTTVRTQDLASLIAKSKAHLDLVEDVNP